MTQAVLSPCSVSAAAEGLVAEVKAVAAKAAAAREEVGSEGEAEARVAEGERAVG